MIKQFGILFLVFVVSLTACDSPTESKDDIRILLGKVGINEIIPEMISRTVIEGYLVGADFLHNECYVLGLLPEDKHYIIKIIDITSGSEIKRVKLKMGSYQSPDEFYGPYYVQHLDRHYYVMDQYHKVVIFDHQFNYRFSSMFHNQRLFMDIYKNGDDTLFLHGTSVSHGKESLCAIDLYHLEWNKRPKLKKRLFASRHPGVYSLNGKKYYHIGYFWPSTWGFEKEGAIYYSDNSTNYFNKYNLKNKETTRFELAYLKANRYSKTEAVKLGSYKGPMWTKKIKREVVFIPNQKDIYHLGLYDAGSGMIGVIGKLDVQETTFRLDLLESVSGQYLYSVRLPFGQKLISKISTDNMGFSYSHIRMDQGVYIWSDIDNENRESFVVISRFKKITVGKVINER